MPAQGTTSDFSGENPFGEPLKRAWLNDLETTSDFWNRTPQLQLIAYEAAEQDISPWGLLLAVQQHQASHIDATHVLVGAKGKPGRTLAAGTSLSGYGALTADTGGGKTAVFRTATDLVPPSSMPVADGTGQGLVKSIAETEKVTKDEDGKPCAAYYVTRFHNHSLMVHGDEIETLNAEIAREGTKTPALMRSMWVGTTVGMTTGDKERRVTLPANMYRIHGMWGVQPENAHGILSAKQVRGGTPQRWVWAPCKEFRTPRPVRVAPPAGTIFALPVWNVGNNPFGTSGGALPESFRKGDDLPTPTWITRNASPKMQQWVKDAQDAQEAADDRDPYSVPTPEEKAVRAALKMAAHNILTTIKASVWMAWLHGRCEPIDLDFELALVQMQVSRAEAAGVWQSIAIEVNGERQSLGEQRGIDMHIANVARDNAEFTETQEVAEQMWQRLATEGSKPLRALRDGLSTRRRKLASEARGLLEDAGRIRPDMYGHVWAFTENGMPVAPKGSPPFKPRVE